MFIQKIPATLVSLVLMTSSLAFAGDYIQNPRYFRCTGNLKREASTIDDQTLVSDSATYGDLTTISVAGSMIKGMILADLPGQFHLETGSGLTLEDLDAGVMFKVLRPAIYSQGDSIVFWSTPNRTKITAHVAGAVGSGRRGYLELGLAGHVLFYDLACDVN